MHLDDYPSHLQASPQGDPLPGSIAISDTLNAPPVNYRWVTAYLTSGDPHCLLLADLPYATVKVDQTDNGYQFLVTVNSKRSPEAFTLRLTPEQWACIILGTCFGTQRLRVNLNAKPEFGGKPYPKIGKTTASRILLDLPPFLDAKPLTTHLTLLPSNFSFEPSRKSHLKGREEFITRALEERDLWFKRKDAPGWVTRERYREVMLQAFSRLDQSEEMSGGGSGSSPNDLRFRAIEDYCKTRHVPQATLERLFLKPFP